MLNKSSCSKNNLFLQTMKQGYFKILTANINSPIITINRCQLMVKRFHRLPSLRLPPTLLNVKSFAKSTNPSINTSWPLMALLLSKTLFMNAWSCLSKIKKLQAIRFSWEVANFTPRKGMGKK